MKNDDAYANAAFIPGSEQYLEDWPMAAMDFRAVEASIGRARLNVAYGDHPRQALDLFVPAGPAVGLMVFVHGGYWMRFDRSDWSHFAAGAVARDWAVAMPGYVLAPDATIPEITTMVAQSIEKAASYVRGPLVLTGHSAGGHLVARMANGGHLSDDVAGRIANIVPISPVVDLQPLLDTTMNETLNLDAQTAQSESPALHAKTYDVPVHTWVGGDERPAFLDQAQTLASAWGTDLTVAPGQHHFNVIDGLQDPDSPLMNAILGQGA